MPLLDKITPIDIFISKKLRRFRLLSGISQEKLGDLTGVTSQQIQKYEKALNRIPASRLFEFSQILTIPMADFFEGLEADPMYYNYDFKSNETQQREKEEFDQEVLPLVRAFSNISNREVRKNLINLTNSLAIKKNHKVKHQYS